MSTINWAFGITGYWSDKTKWSFGAVPTSADDVTVSAVGAYNLGVVKAASANTLTFNAASAKLVETATGSLDIVGAFDLMAGTAYLAAANTFGSVDESGGVLQLANANALGSAQLNLTDGEVTGMVTETIGNYLSMSNADVGLVLDAATGSTVDFGGGGWGLGASAGTVLQFGSATRRGTVVWHTAAGSSIAGGIGDFAVNVAGGTLKAGDSTFGFLLGNDGSTTIAAGATIDLGGFSTGIVSLEGAGGVVNSGAGAALQIYGGSFSGAISGAIAVEIADTTEFSGVNAYSQGTAIDSGATLYLAGKGAITGGVIDNGVLYDLESSGTVNLGAISGVGSLTQAGAGTLVLNAANTYSGGTTITAGKVSIGNGAALGTGAVVLDNAELLATATLAVLNSYTLRDSVTMAAAAGKTFTFDGQTGAGDINWDASSSPLNLNIGDSADTGTVTLGYSDVGSISFTDPIHLTVAYGTLKAGSGLSFFTDNVASFAVNKGATVDLNGSAVIAPALTNAGLITNSATTTGTLYAGNTSVSTGVIAGKTSVTVFNGTLTLTAANTYSQGTTIGSGATLKLGAGGATGSIIGAINDAGALIVNETGAVSLTGVISGAGTVTQSGSGVTTLSGLNTYGGGTTIQHGEVVVTNAKSLGLGSVTLDGGELLATATLALAATQASGNSFTFNGADTIAAAHGATLTIGGAAVQVNAATLNFGEGGNDGTVIFKVASGLAPGPFMIKVNAGTLKAGDAVFGDLTEIATSITVAAGATLDVGGFTVVAPNLTNAGTIANSAATAGTLYTLGASKSSGVITGRLALKVLGGALTLTGANTFTQGSTISSGATLRLGAGGALGSLTGNIDDQGALVVNETAAVSLSGLIYDTGTLTQAGTGATTLSAVNIYSGGTTIQRGEIIATNAHALGAGLLTMTGGELLTTATQIQTHDLHTGGAVTFAAADATTLALVVGNYTADAGRIYFGEGANDGTILYQATGGLSITDPAATTLEVRAGTLKARDGTLSALLGGIGGTRLDAGATLDLAGHALDINGLTGAGALTNSGAATVLTLFGATNFSGVISGKYTEVDVFNTAILSGGETFTGPMVIESGKLSLYGIDAESVIFNGGGTLVLAAPARFTGAMEDFASGSTIDLRNITTGAAAALSYNAVTGVLTVSDGPHTDKLTFSGSYVAGNFVATSDGAGGANIGWQAPPAMAKAPATSTPATHPFISAMAALAPADAGASGADFQARRLAATMLASPGLHAA